MLSTLKYKPLFFAFFLIPLLFPDALSSSGVGAWDITQAHNSFFERIF
jgi:hypothetical protein